MGPVEEGTRSSKMTYAKVVSAEFIEYPGGTG